jgi:hypothetical protein
MFSRGAEADHKGGAWRFPDVIADYLIELSPGLNPAAMMARGLCLYHRYTTVEEQQLRPMLSTKRPGPTIWLDM